MIKLITIVGTRPQFVKAATVSRSILSGYVGRVQEVLVHTGQHHDHNMSKIFFDVLDISEPAYNLNIAGGTHGAMTGRMIEAIEKLLQAENPDHVLIYGDTNSTLAGALAAAKLNLSIVHVEAGLRSFNMRMPEEVNRILTDRVSSLLFCPTDAAVANLSAEGITRGVHNVGDVMYDAALFYADRADRISNIVRDLGLKPKGFALATVHRAENTDDKQRLSNIFEGLSAISKQMPVIIPLHPRTSQMLIKTGLEAKVRGLRILPPLPYLDMVALERAAKVICTDSGGVQKEAYFFETPCVTMRDETEWIELLETGWNELTGADANKIVAAVERASESPKLRPRLYGDGNAAQNILRILAQ